MNHCQKFAIYLVYLISVYFSLSLCWTFSLCTCHCVMDILSVYLSLCNGLSICEEFVQVYWAFYLHICSNNIQSICKSGNSEKVAEGVTCALVRFSQMMFLLMSTFRGTWVRESD